METTITWEVKVNNTPLLIKKCSHCDSDRFYCSDKFRMNAQKKNIDVWLIYRCVKCDNTCNLTLLSRSKPDLINIAFSTGTLDKTMATIAENAEKKVSAVIQTSVARFEPTMVIIMAVAVGFILLSVMIPLMSVMTVIG